MCDASTEQHRPLTYAPFGPWGRLLCAIPPLIVCCLIPLPLRMVRWSKSDSPLSYPFLLERRGHGFLDCCRVHADRPRRHST